MDDSNKSWKLIKSEFVNDLKIFKSRFDYYQNPYTNKEVKVTVLTANDAVNVVGVTEANKILFVRQFRFGTQKQSLEVPGGFVEEGEEPIQAAKRELLEETGYSGAQWKSLGIIYSNPVYQNARIHHFLATGIKKTDATRFDDEEYLEPYLFSRSELKQAIAKNEITHPHTISALSRVFNLYDGEAL